MVQGSSDPLYRFEYNECTERGYHKLNNVKLYDYHKIGINF